MCHSPGSWGRVMSHANPDKKWSPKFRFCTILDYFCSMHWSWILLKNLIAIFEEGKGKGFIIGSKESLKLFFTQTLTPWLTKWSFFFPIESNHHKNRMMGPIQCFRISGNSLDLWEINSVVFHINLSRHVKKIHQEMALILPWNECVPRSWRGFLHSDPVLPQKVAISISNSCFLYRILWAFQW